MQLHLPLPAFVILRINRTRPPRTAQGIDPERVEALGVFFVLVPTSNQIDAYRKAKLRTARANRFGREMGGGKGVKGRPVHRNTRTDPLPHTKLSQDGQATYRDKATTTKKTDRDHGIGKRALFHVSNGNGREQRYALDFDGDGSVPYEKRAEAIRRVVAKLWPSLLPFIETSRSRTGVYVWLRVRMPHVDPLLANLVERIVNRELKERLHHKRDPLHLDAIKGCAAYEVPNPHFDDVLAHSLLPKAVTQFEVEPGEWMERREAKRYLRAVGSHRELGDLPTRQELVEKTRLELYERDKLFYGLSYETGEKDRKARFSFNKRLERTWKAFGVLITDICYGQPERLDEATAWLNNKAGCITLQQFVRFIPAWAQDIIKQVRDHKLGHRDAYEQYLSRKKDRPAKAAGPRSTPAVVAATSGPAMTVPHAAHVPLPPGDRDAACLKSPNCWDGYGASARLIFRQVGCSPQTQSLAMALYEQHGQATGFDDYDREKRWNDIGRCVDHWALTFDPKLAKARRGEALDSLLYVKHLNAIARELDARIPRFVIEHHCANRPKSKTPITETREVMLRVLAVVLGHTAHNIHTGKLRQVPCNNPLVGLRAENARRRRAKKKKLPSDEKHSAAAVEILEAAGMLVVTRRHHAQARQCTQRALGKTALRMQSLAWLVEVAGDRDQLQVAPAVDQAEVAAAFMPRWNREQVMRKFRAQASQAVATAVAASAHAMAHPGAGAHGGGIAAAQTRAAVHAARLSHSDNPFAPSPDEVEAEQYEAGARTWEDEVIWGTKWEMRREVA